MIIRLLVFTLFTLVSFTSTQSTDTVECDTTWSQATSMKGNVPSGRSWPVFRTIGEKIYMFGGVSGYGHDEIFDDTYYYSTDRNSWEKKNSQSQTKWTASAGDIIGDSLWVFGGKDEQGTFHNQVYQYRIFDDTWEFRNATGIVPNAKNGHTATAIGSDLYIFGGWDGTTYFNELDYLNTNKQSWANAKSSTHSPKPRNGHTSVEFGGELYIFGGYFESQGHKTFFQDLWQYSPTMEQWKQIYPESLALPSARMQQGAVTFGSYMFIFGGSNDPNGRTFLDDFWRFSFYDQRWQQITGGETPSAREGMGITVVGSHLYIFGGLASGDGPDYSDMYIHDLSECAGEAPEPIKIKVKNEDDVGQSLGVAVSIMVFLLLFMIGIIIASVVFFIVKRAPRGSYDTL